jgi:hypothetical protein
MHARYYGFRVMASHATTAELNWMLGGRTPTANASLRIWSVQVGRRIASARYAVESHNGSASGQLFFPSLHAIDQIMHQRVWEIHALCADWIGSIEFTW